jgi:hypothetical protein
MSFLKRIHRAVKRITAMPEALAQMQVALGRIEQRQVLHHASSIREAEFKVFSQWGEDGIIQYLVHRVPVERPIFVEFGVENYTESNTRFLAINNGWSGLVIDGSAENIAFIRRDPIYWSNNIKAEHSFITAENINDILGRNGISGDIGLLSVDIDGNDYWVWEAINVISPRLVVCEYNSLFGPTAQVTTPYDPGFVRDRAHHSKVFYGASISALTALAARKGFTLVAANSAGNNVFFVRNDIVGSFQPLTPQVAYRQSRFREHHDSSGRLSHFDFAERLASIADQKVVELTTGSTLLLRDVPGVMNA